MMRSGTVRQRPARRRAFRPFNVRWAALIAVCTLLCGCAGPANPKVEAPPSSPSPRPEQQQTAVLPAPNLDQAQQAVKRVFKDNALVDTTHNPSFIGGDFNGDLSQDIAVILKPAPGKLAEMNEEFPSWILRDLFAPNEPGKQPLRVAENDVLLAIIHGYGPNGWRDPKATQTYLLKNAAGSDLEARPGKEFVAANSDKKLPRVHGDLIGEVLHGKAGYLYYSGATYSWYDPKTFKEEPLRSLVHDRAPAGIKK